MGQFGLFVLALVAVGAFADDCEQSLTECRAKARETEDMCGGLQRWLTCVSEKGHSCKLRETGGFTFQDLSKVAKDSCAAIQPIESSFCNELTACLTTTKFSKLLGADLSTLYDTRRTGFWCELLDEVMGCFIGNKDACSFDENTISSITQKQKEAKKACPGGIVAASSPGPMLPSFLLPCAAVLLLRLVLA